MNLKKYISAAIVAVALPFAASAATVSGNVDFDDETMTGTVYVPGASEFNIAFDSEDLGDEGILHFDIVNESSSSVKIDVFSYTINQGANGDGVTNFGFQNGVDLWFAGETIDMIGEGESVGKVVTDLMVAGGSTTELKFDYGAIISLSGIYPDIDFRIVATVVPLPAAGFMLIGALGGLAFVRRKKTA